MFVNNIRNFIFEDSYKRIGFSKEDSYYSMKRLERKNLLANKLIDSGNAKEHYESFLREKSKNQQYYQK